jgi:hypothetical protein
MMDIITTTLNRRIPMLLICMNVLPNPYFHTSSTPEKIPLALAGVDFS